MCMRRLDISEILNTWHVSGIFLTGILLLSSASFGFLRCNKCAHAKCLASEVEHFTRKSGGVAGAISSVFRIIREFWGKFCLIERSDVLWILQSVDKIYFWTTSTLEDRWERFTATGASVTGKRSVVTKICLKSEECLCSFHSILW